MKSMIRCPSCGCRRKPGHEKRVGTENAYSKGCLPLAELRNIIANETKIRKQIIEDLKEAFRVPDENFSKGLISLKEVVEKIATKNEIKPDDIITLMKKANRPVFNHIFKLDREEKQRAENIARAEAKAKAEAEAKAKAEAEVKAKAEAEEEAKAKAEADAKARAEAEAKAKTEAAKEPIQ